MATENLNGGEGRGNPFDSARRAFSDTAASLTDQVGERAREYTVQGKDRAVEALDNVASLVGDAAAQVSERLGDQYGGYIHQAADAFTGLADSLREKDADQLFDDARALVRNSPAIALAAAAAVGFVVARVVKSGLNPAAAARDTDDASAPVAEPAATSPRKRKTAATETAPQPGEAIGETTVQHAPPAADSEV